MKYFSIILLLMLSSCDFVSDTSTNIQNNTTVGCKRVDGDSENLNVQYDLSGKLDITFSCYFITYHF